ncbi:FG-GAP-like repeat-containing protein [Planctomycetota bacterium]
MNRLSFEACENRCMLTVLFESDALVSQNDISSPGNVVATDYDNDGDIDLIVPGTNRLLWYENTESGIQSRPKYIMESEFPLWDVAVGDLNGDQNPDLVVMLGPTHPEEQIVFVTSGEPEPEISSLGTQISTRQFSTGDIDGDGDNDVLMVTRFNQIVWLENLDGDGRDWDVRDVAAMTPASKAVLSDADGDGDMDIFTADFFNEELVWFENTGSYNNPWPEQVIDTYEDLALGIWVGETADGKLEVVVASSDALHFYTGDRDGTFKDKASTPVAFAGEAGRVVNIEIVDFNGDGVRDVVYREGTSTTAPREIYWLRGVSPYTFASPKLLTVSDHTGSEYSIADLDGDDDLDIAVSAFYEHTVSIYYNTDGQGTFSRRLLDLSAEEPSAIFPADFDNDGDLDLVSGSFASGAIMWHENNSETAEFGSRHFVDTTAEGVLDVHAADLDGDGLQDILAAAARSDELIWYRNVGDGFTKSDVITDKAIGASSVYAADLDGDGDQDVIEASLRISMVAWYENLDGNGDFGDRRIINNGIRRPQQVKAADMDGDGDLDVISVSSTGEGEFISAHRILWYENDGTGNFINGINVSRDEVFGLRAIELGDFNGDGDLDIVAASAHDDTVSLFLSSGRGQQWERRTIDNGSFGASSVAVADVDNDGDPDVIAASSEDDTVAWFENRGSANFGPRTAISSLVDGAVEVIAADFNNDGWIDVATAAAEGDSISWNRNLGPSLVPGDFTGDGQVSASDADRLCLAIKNEDPNSIFDVNDDARIDHHDMQTFLSDIAQRTPGDVNFDGVFDSRDLVQLFQNRKYQTGNPASWSEGDFNCDGEFTTRDLVVAFQSGKYVSN